MLNHDSIMGVDFAMVRCGLILCNVLHHVVSPLLVYATCEAWGYQLLSSNTSTQPAHLVV